MKIVIINAKYSKNLGDGVIAECLEYYLKKGLPDANICSLDLSGWTRFHGIAPTRGISDVRIENFFSYEVLDQVLIRNIPRILCRSIKSVVSAVALRFYYPVKWGRILRSCDAVIIGGGQLFQDAELYFPRRMLACLRCLSPHIPVFIFAVGVSQKFTPLAKKLFDAGLCDRKVAACFVRDKISQENWQMNFPYITPQIARDPGLLAQERYYGLNTFERKHKCIRIAIGITGRKKLLAHAEEMNRIAYGTLDFYLDIIRELAKTYQVFLFTNGADEDVRYMHDVVSLLRKEGIFPHKNIVLQTYPVLPVDLVADIASCDLVLSHRLHANIVAYSLGIPSVGLDPGWDRKMSSFFDFIGRSHCFLSGSALGTNDIVTFIEGVLEDAINERDLQRVKTETEDGIKKLVSAIKIETSLMKPTSGSCST